MTEDTYYQAQELKSDMFTIKDNLRKLSAIEFSMNQDSAKLYDLQITLNQNSTKHTLSIGFFDLEFINYLSERMHQKYGELEKQFAAL